MATSLIVFYATSLSVLGLSSLYLTKITAPKMWNSKTIRYGLMLLFAGGFLVPAIMMGLFEFRWHLAKISAGFGLLIMSIFTLYMFVVSSGKMLSSLFRQKHPRSGAAVQEARSETKPPQPESLIDKGKRKFILGFSSALPAVLFTSSAHGYVNANSFPEKRIVNVKVKNLDARLKGLRILHISDLHLGRMRTLPQFEEILQEAAKERPDMALITGDFCDDMDQMKEAAALVSNMSLPLGAIACMGNHEYFRDVDRIKEAYNEAGIPLLINEGRIMRHKDASFFVGALDDPRHLEAEMDDFYADCMTQTMTHRPHPMFSVIMSHRPNAFDQSKEFGADLMLAGHTHGMQVGLFERSIFEPFMPNSYLWGHYQKGDHHLYTTSGMGQWLRFRLGCPSEIPIIVVNGE